MQGNIFAVPWSADHPLTTPSGLADPQVAASTLDAVATYVQSTYGSLDVPWGNVYRLRAGNVDYPASGGGVDGVFRVLAFVPSSDPNIFQAQSGDTYIAAVAFSSAGVHAKVLITYGNSTQPGSPHSSDQLALYAHSQLRDAWFTLDDVMRHTATSEAV
jgi:acyl-homoserine-lactone acylase